MIMTGHATSQARYKQDTQDDKSQKPITTLCIISRAISSVSHLSQSSQICLRILAVVALSLFEYTSTPCIALTLAKKAGPVSDYMYAMLAYIMYEYGVWEISQFPTSEKNSDGVFSGRSRVE